MDKKSKNSLGNYAFIDSQNVNVSTQKFGWKMNWRELRKFLEEKYNVSTAFMFIGYVPEFEALYEQMHEAGFSVVLKPTYDMTRPYKGQPEPTPVESGVMSKEYKSFGEKAAAILNSEQKDLPAGRPTEVAEADQTEAAKRHIKGNIDAELVLWAMKELKNYDKAVIVSGDGDFYCLVEYLHEQKKLLKLLVPSMHYSGLYRAYENYIERLDKDRRRLAYRDRRPAKRPIVKK